MRVSAAHPPSAASEQRAPAEPHPLDLVSLGKIVQIREQLLAAAAQGKKVYRLESGDPSFAVAPHVLDAIDAAARAGKTHYVPNDGIPQLREALAAKVRRQNGLQGVTASDIYVTNGAMHALYTVFGALLEPGDEVIIPDPMWTEVAENIRLAGGVPVGVTLSAADDFAYSPELVAAAITARTRAIFVNTPHNPTGAILPRETLAAIATLARDRGLWIVSDEAYEDLLFGDAAHVSIGSLPEADAEHVVSIYSFSKSHAMSGLRVGYIVTRAALLHDRIPKLLRCTINGVNSLAQWGALAAVTGSREPLAAMRAEYAKRRDLLLGALGGIDGVRPFAPRGAFYLWVELDQSLYARLGVEDADDLSRALAEQGIGSAPGDAFGRSCNDAIRFAFSCDTEMVREGSAALRRVLTGETPLAPRAA
ncbi:MAG: aminotransferase class I/II-fold pyridoxal phosphate-dependent enzyme [Gemmatimonadaceae bacterium]|nr:aminotransferase class I/II-fold pyridoxal phosphate-dependent enzyme [Gemmatimonadaceae bacterium]NUQ91744.1 aminotransferase class I/II-fold pyridoxal phosphate-dependent enzyme [Gemmatimonadaceae bacterium]NUR18758.1 aminotransferase class I/II-fold pyridoxal phosphate-dependent enzyme [Gemmatimonadaceae bacterium]NUS97776.1 aminotransferase class I/II-fold pyridoxal phosphate-dependent enzyme [Gemmatimonadaceae bacterium]